MLRWRRDPQEKASGKAEGRQEEDAPVRQGGNPPAGVHLCPQDGRLSLWQAGSPPARQLRAARQKSPSPPSCSSTTVSAATTAPAPTSGPQALSMGKLPAKASAINPVRVIVTLLSVCRSMRSALGLLVTGDLSVDHRFRGALHILGKSFRRLATGQASHQRHDHQQSHHAPLLDLSWSQPITWGLSRRCVKAPGGDLPIMGPRQKRQTSPIAPANPHTPVISP